MDTVKYGIIGIGNMGSAHTQFISQLKNCVLTAVCDINPEAFDRIPENARPKNLQKFTDADTFFAEGDMDAVIIAVPHYFHPDMALRALAAGKHIIVEKPIAVHKNEAMRLIEGAKKYPNLIKSAMFNQRTHTAHKKIKHLIDSRELGTLRRVNWTITDWFRSQCYYDSGDWRASWRGEGGGVLLNQCPHQLDLFQWFFGMPAKVRAFAFFGKYHDIEVEDEVNAYLEYANGMTANFIASTSEIPGTNRLEIVGDRGRLVFEDGKIEFKRSEQDARIFSKETEMRFGIPDIWNCTIPGGMNPNQHRDIIENVADAILTGKPLIAPMEEGINALELGNAMMLSAWMDKTIELPMNGDDYAARLAKLVETSRYPEKVVKPATAGENFSKSF